MFVFTDFNLDDYVEPMIWEYRTAEQFSLRAGELIIDGPLWSREWLKNADIFAAELWEKYSKIFSKIWIASAFKGAISSCQVHPIVGNYVNNHEKWLNVLAKIRNKFKKIRGLTLTGWSR